MAVNPVTNRVYVTNIGGNTVTVIDGATNGVIGGPVGVQPTGVAVNPDTNLIYVVNRNSNS